MGLRFVGVGLVTRGGFGPRVVFVVNLRGLGVVGAFGAVGAGVVSTSTGSGSSSG